MTLLVGKQWKAVSNVFHVGKKEGGKFSAVNLNRYIVFLELSNHFEYLFVLNGDNILHFIRTLELKVVYILCPEHKTVRQ